MQLFKLFTMKRHHWWAYSLLIVSLLPVITTTSTTTDYSTDSTTLDDTTVDDTTTTITTTTTTTATTTSTTTEATTTASTTTTTTTVDPILEACSSLGTVYQPGQCNCHLDECLGTIYQLRTRCPTCGIYTLPPTTTPYDWGQLFEGQAPQDTTTENGEDSTSTEDYFTTDETTITTTTIKETTTTMEETTTTTLPTTILTTTTIATTTTGTTTMGTDGTDTTAETTTRVTTAQDEFTTTVETTTVSENTTHITTTIQTTTISTEPPLCTFMAYGIVVNDMDNYDGERCCCPSEMFYGEELNIVLKTNMTFDRTLKDKGQLVTQALLQQVYNELVKIMEITFDNEYVEFSLNGFEKASGSGNFVAVNTTLTVMQSRVDNDVWVKDKLRSILLYYTYQDPADQVFGHKIKYYQKHYYNYDEILVTRNFPEGIYAPTNGTEATTNAPDVSDPYAFMFAFIPIGFLLIAVVLLYLFVRTDVCLLKSWVK